MEKNKLTLLLLFLILSACSINPDPNSAKGGNPGIGSPSQIITTVAGIAGSSGYGGDGGSALSALLNVPYGISIDTSGNIYIADYGCNVIRKVATNGIITTVAGTGTAGSGGDNGPATNAQLNMPWGVFADAKGNIYIADSGNHAIRKVDTNGMISTTAGTLGSSGTLNFPTGVCADTAGNIYIADNNNFIVRKVSSAGTMSIIAGTPGMTGNSGDGGNAVNALLGTPRGVCVDNSGNIYIADYGYNTVRKVNTSGIISTIAGKSISAGYSGDGGNSVNALLYAPAGVFADTAGNIYIADTGNNVIRKINSSGNIITVAGSGSCGYGGNNSPSTSTLLNFPSGVCADSSGNIYIADAANNIIRKVH